jgi:hypothetical protein
VLPLVNRTAKALGHWLSGAFFTDDENARRFKKSALA